MADDEYKKIFKIILLGDSGVGKTNILTRYTKDDFSDSTKSTVGVELGTKIEEINNTKIKIQIWDTAGEERYKSITKAYYKGSKGALIVYDISRKETFANVDKWISELKETGEDDICIILIGNKCDLKDKREVTIEEVKKKAEIFKVGFLETSALTSENIEAAFHTLIKEILEKAPPKDQKYGNHSSVVNNGVTLETKIIAEDKRPKSDKGCC